MTRLFFASLYALFLSAHAARYTIEVAPGGSLRFSPSSLEISPGDSVSFVFRSSPHTVTFGSDCQRDGSFELTSPGVRTFDEEGSYGFFCSLPGHCRQGMRGSIVVTRSSSSSSSPTRPSATATTTATTPASTTATSATNRQTISIGDATPISTSNGTTITTTSTNSSPTTAVTSAGSGNDWSVRFAVAGLGGLLLLLQQ